MNRPPPPSGALRGIGPWTASGYLLRTRARHDVLPPGDLALRAAWGWLQGRTRRPPTPSCRPPARRGGPGVPQQRFSCDTATRRSTETSSRVGRPAIRERSHISAWTSSRLSRYGSQYSVDPSDPGGSPAARPVADQPAVEAVACDLPGAVGPAGMEAGSSSLATPHPVGAN
jgi:hypothetical protein